MPKSFLLPEWQPVHSVLIAWPHLCSDWSYCLEQAQACYENILSALSQKVLVRVLLHPSIEQEKWLEAIVSSLGSRVNHNNIIIHSIEYDDTWIRDYGPLSLSTGFLDVCFDGWGKKYSALKDNDVNIQLERYLAGQWLSDAFVLEGGALEINDDRVLLANKNCVLDPLRNPNMSPENIEKKLYDLLGLSEILWIEGIVLSGDDTDGHIDTMARFTKNLGIVYSGPNAHHPDAHVLENLDSQIQKIAQQKNYRCFPLPSPIVHSQFDNSLLPATYANFLHCNNTVFAPTYGLSTDNEALSVLSQAFPESSVVPVRCEMLLEQHGSLHCATMQVHRS